MKNPFWILLSEDKEESLQDSALGREEEITSLLEREESLHNSPLGREGGILHEESGKNLVLRALSR